MVAKIASDKKAILTVLILLGFSAWWLVLHLSPHTPSDHILDCFAGTYGLVALLGGVWGLSIARRWGGWSSVIGRSIMMFSLGLIAQEFGQLTYAYYAIAKGIEVPYPSIGDIGFFGSVIFYIYGVALLAKAAGATVSLKKVGSKLIGLLAPLILLITSYMFFLKGYEFDWSYPLTIFLDFGYPFGQAIYIAIAILAFLLSAKLLGGVMRNKIIFIILALCAQYAADFNFLFQSSRETWSTAGYGDYLYLVSYVLMTLAILNINAKYLNNGKSDERQ